MRFRLQLDPKRARSNGSEALKDPKKASILRALGGPGGDLFQLGNQRKP